MLNKRTIEMLFFGIMMLTSPALAVQDADDNAVGSLINPVAGLNEVLNSPAGEPIKKVLNLVVGFAILYTLGALIKDYLNSQSDNSEKSSSGFLNMGKHTVGLLVLLVCLGFVGVFMNYSL